MGNLVGDLVAGKLGEYCWPGPHFFLGFVQGELVDRRNTGLLIERQCGEKRTGNKGHSGSPDKHPGGLTGSARFPGLLRFHRLNPLGKALNHHHVNKHNSLSGKSLDHFSPEATFSALEYPFGQADLTGFAV